MNTLIHPLAAIAAAAMFTLTSAGCATAPHTDEKAAAPAKMVYADQDRDGKVTKREAKVDKALLASFGRYDANKDDELGRAEFARLEAESAARNSDLLHRWARPRDEFARPGLD